MAIDFSNTSPLATALQELVQPKLEEFGWTTGGDDTQIFEYILLMLANEKNESQIASELSNDLLDLGPENAETQQFAHWLFEQIDVVSRQLNGGPAGNTEAAQSTSNQQENTMGDAPSTQDVDMDGAAEPAQDKIPTGPKAMRNGSGSSAQPTRGGGRMLNNLKNQMSNNDDPLRRVRGSQGGGRINSHSREPPKGPRSQNLGRGVAAMANGRGMGSMGSNVNMGPGPGAMNGMNGMNNMGPGTMPGMPMAPMGANGMPGILNPQQQMALMQMYEQQAQMMQQIFSGGAPTPLVNPNFSQGNRGGHKKPLSQRIDRSSQPNNRLPPSTKFTKKDSQDATMADGAAAENGDGSAMEIEGGRPDPFTIMCKFNLRCTKSDCPFVHQSPAAPEGTPVDMKDTCTYGAACTNKKCVGRHASPAQRQQYQAEQDCVFFPNCRDMANCPYKHPSMPPCRNGADCTTPGCKFWHNTVMCKFFPTCTNFRCPYKHVEGQKKTFKDKVWVAPKNGEEATKEHVSERKFVDEGAEEELIIPGKTSEDVMI